MTDGSSPVYEEKFKNIYKQLTDLQNDSKHLKEKSDENENGKIINGMQIMFDAMKEDAKKIALQAVEDAKKIETLVDKRDARAEDRAGKRDQAIEKIAESLNKYSNSIETLTLKVNGIDEKVIAIDTKYDDLAKKVETNSNKTKVDTSGWVKWMIGIIGTCCGAVIVLVIKKKYNL